MLASSFVDRRVISMFTPSAAKQAMSTESPSAVLIRVGRDGMLDLSGEPMTPAELAEEVASRSLGDTTYMYLVQPDVGVSVQQIVSVLDLLRNAGAREVSLTRKPRS